MSIDARSFAERSRPREDRSAPKAFQDSILDAGSPQYVRPEDLLLDIYCGLFDIPRKDGRQIGGIDPNDFEKRWLRDGAPQLTISRVGTISNETLAKAALNLMRTSRRRKEKYPTLLPIVPALGQYKNISPKLPHFLSDELIPALYFADEEKFADRILQLGACVGKSSHNSDPAQALAVSLLPSQELKLKEQKFKNPVLKDFTCDPSGRLPVCLTLGEALDFLLEYESKLPRVLWTRWLAAVLRLWLPMFFLRRCLVTNSAADAAESVLRGEKVPDVQTLSDKLFANRRILRGSSEYLNQLVPIVQQYVRARLRISIILDLTSLHDWLTHQGLDPQDRSIHEEILKKLNTLEPADLPQDFGRVDKTLAMPDDSGVGFLPFSDWLKWIEQNLTGLNALASMIASRQGSEFVDLIYAYLRPAYEPLTDRFGKNAYEFVAYTLGAPRKIERDPEFPDAYNLVYRGEGGRHTRRIVIQPGAQLLALLVQIVTHRSAISTGTSAKLSDLLDLSDALGIDFRSEAADFEALKGELLRTGLLQSSADAAEAASLKAAYSL